MIMVVTGFSRCIRITNSFVVELWCLRDGLIMRCNLNITSIVVELDAKAIVDVFHKPDYKNNVLYSILDDCKQLISRFCQVQFMHCFCRTNYCVDMLARIIVIKSRPEVDLVYESLGHWFNQWVISRTTGSNKKNFKIKYI